MRVHLKDTGDTHPLLVCSVSDSGIGISEKHLELLFKPFEQADSSFARKAQGTGLGLSITAKLIELMHGTIKVKSKLGEGSTFVFTLPMRVAKKTKRKGDSHIASRIEEINTLAHDKYTALVVEDNEINQVVITSLLSQLGIRCIAAENGEVALDFLKTQTENTIDFILMDCQMPIMDGFETTRKIRTDPHYNRFATTPIIALTANAMVGDKEKCFSAGMDDYLSKPVREATLKTMLLKWLKGR